MYMTFINFNKHYIVHLYFWSQRFYSCGVSDHLEMKEMGIEDDAFQVCVQSRITIWPLECQLLNEIHCMHHIRTVQTEVKSKTQDANI